MILLEPTAQHIPQGDGPEAAFNHVARAAALCYGHAPKTGLAAADFCQSLIERKHLSPFRHQSIYYIVPDVVFHDAQIADYLLYCPYVAVRFGKNNRVYLSTNGQFQMENPVLFHLIREYEVSPSEFFAREDTRDLQRLTFECTTQISTARELNRVSPNNITEASTRYIREQKAIVRPHWLSREFADLYTRPGEAVEVFKADEAFRRAFTYLEACNASIENYAWQVDNGVSPQDARGVLPLDTATKVIYTYTRREWRHILDLRYYGKTGKPHPNCVALMDMIVDLIEK